MSLMRSISIKDRPATTSCIPVINEDYADVRELPIEHLITVDYQRPVDRERVQHIVDNFDPHKVNIIKVS